MVDRRWTIITGASSGIGVELARLFAAEGDGLVLVARRRGRLDSLAAELKAAHSVPILVMDLDLFDESSPQALFDFVTGQEIEIHTLVNNAGFGLAGRFDVLPADRLTEMVRLNVEAVTTLSRLFLPGMIERRQGGILNVASMASFQGGPYTAVYSATKAFVLSLSEALHEEALPHGVAVSALCPGPVATEFGKVAHLEDTMLFKRAANAAWVARVGFAGYRANKAIVIPGFFNTLGILLGRLFPRALPRKVAGRLHKLDH
ncbi:SDR family NAD(P)-dependent oxidoreductase [Flaviflagellibacter deserti]|uniref:SDR family NAD(P)-dependent oxidoreductase n=1 Tax=Flaviflagellibacter deserti TaxID=2267266 RepID=A0ABV9Z532_9HYPH